jgi:hypothetical protein
VSQNASPAISFELILITGAFENECSRLLAIYQMRTLADHWKQPDHLVGTTHVVPRDDDDYLVTRSFHLRLIKDNVLHSREPNVCRRDILEIARRVQRQRAEVGHNLSEDDAVAATCEVIYENLGLTQLLKRLGHDRYTLSLYDKFDAEVSAFMVSVGNGWPIERMSIWNNIHGDADHCLIEWVYCGYATSAAARAGRLDLLQKLHERTYRWEESSRKIAMITSLDEAVFHGQQPVIDYLLQPAHSLGSDRGFGSVIRSIVPKRRLEVYKQLIKAKNHPRDFKPGDWFCRWSKMVCKHGEDEIIAWMINQGYSFDSPAYNKHDWTTCINHAVKWNQRSTVKLLLDNGVSLGSDAADAFSVAASEGKVDMLKLFCARGLEDEPPGRLYDGFRTAVIKEQVAAAEYLWSTFDQPRFERVSTFSEGVSCYRDMIFAECVRDKPNMLRWLVDHCKIDINRYLETTLYEAPIIEALMTRKTEAFRVLLGLGAEPVNVTTERVSVLLQCASPLTKECFEMIVLNRDWAAARASASSFQSFLQAREGIHTALSAQ